MLEEVNKILILSPLFLLKHRLIKKVNSYLKSKSKLVEQMETTVIAGFPCIGKSSAAKRLKDRGILAVDLESSVFHWNRFDDLIVPNPTFPHNYLEAITNVIGKVSYVFLSTHEEVISALIANGIKFKIVVPTISADYIKELKSRDTLDSKTVDKIIFNGGEWILNLKNIAEANGIELITLKKNQHLIDLCKS